MYLFNDFICSKVPNLTTKRPKDGMPLLHYCAELGILNRNLVKLLAHQMDEEFQGQLAVEFGKLNCQLTRGPN